MRAMSFTERWRHEIRHPPSAENIFSTFNHIAKGGSGLFALAAFFNLVVTRSDQYTEQLPSNVGMAITGIIVSTLWAGAISAGRAGYHYLVRPVTVAPVRALLLEPVIEEEPEFLQIDFRKLHPERPGAPARQKHLNLSA